MKMKQYDQDEHGNDARRKKTSLALKPNNDLMKQAMKHKKHKKHKKKKRGEKNEKNQRNSRQRERSSQERHATKMHEQEQVRNN